jgi:predicted enzyme related to lactoylglutathione lyase
MALDVVNITFDSTDPDKLAEWWARAVDGTVNALAPGFFVTVSRPGGGPGLAFQKVGDPTPGKNRVHIDFTSADMEAEVKRLVDLGATEAGRGEAGPDFQWVVMADPDGNAFCVAGSEVENAT